MVPSRDLNTVGPYGKSDKSHSTTDPERLKRAREAEAAINTGRDYIVGIVVDNAYINQDARAAACAFEWLDAWAKEGSLLGNLHNTQGDYTRVWTLATMATAYFNLVDSGFSPSSQEAQTRIEEWLLQLGLDAMKATKDHMSRHPLSYRNNHLAWAAYASGIAAAAMSFWSKETQALWSFASLAYKEALAQLRRGRSDTLAFEIGRRSLALSYHAFAATPLVGLAELAQYWSNENWYTKQDGNLHRLVATVVKGVADPQSFSKLLRRVEPMKQAPPNFVAFFAFYRRRFPERFESIKGWESAWKLAEKNKFYTRWLGGNLAAMASRWIDGPQDY